MTWIDRTPDIVSRVAELVHDEGWRVVLVDGLPTQRDPCTRSTRFAFRRLTEGGALQERRFQIADCIHEVDDDEVSTSAGIIAQMLRTNQNPGEAEYRVNM